MAIQAEEPLETDTRQRRLGRGDLELLLGFHSLVQPVAPGAVGHEPTGEFVDDHDLVLLHDVLLIAQEQVRRGQGLADQLLSSTGAAPFRESL